MAWAGPQGLVHAGLLLWGCSGCMSISRKLPEASRPGGENKPVL